jgi:hypothetical protein
MTRFLKREFMDDMKLSRRGGRRRRGKRKEKKGRGGRGGPSKGNQRQAAAGEAGRVAAVAAVSRSGGGGSGSAAGAGNARKGTDRGSMRRRGGGRRWGGGEGCGAGPGWSQPLFAVAGAGAGPGPSCPWVGRPWPLASGLLPLAGRSGEPASGSKAMTGSMVAGGGQSSSAAELRVGIWGWRMLTVIPPKIGLMRDCA